MASLWTKFTDIFSRNKSGVVPQAPSGTGTSKYLREDGTWAVPSGGGGGGSSTLADLEDVNLSSLSDGQNLSYNASSQMWENKTPSASKHNYSTTEQVVGTWVDGKPIYECSYYIHPTGNTEYGTNDFLIPNVETVVKSEFTVRRASSYNYVWFYSGNGTNAPEAPAYSQYKVGVRVSSGYLQHLIAGYGTEITDMWVTLQYTKTTD